MTTLQEHLMNARDTTSDRVVEDYDYPFAPRIVCADGFSMSVQATHGAYCHPRTNIAQWTHVEVGFPSAKPEEFYQYADDDKDLTGTIYGYVPIELVEECIKNHGGMLPVNNLFGMGLK